MNIIADDSMMGRDTPSPGLEMTAQYVADQFKSFGLKPGGERGPGSSATTSSRPSSTRPPSHVGFMAGGQHVHADFIGGARFQFGMVPKGRSGARPADRRRLDPKGLEAVDAKGKVVLYRGGLQQGSRGRPPMAR